MTEIGGPAGVIEEWRPIPGYEGYYEVSSLGNVRSIDRRVRSRWDSPKLYVGSSLAAERNHHGYYRVRLCREGTQRRFMVHQLVLEAFRGPRPDGLLSRHYNDDKSDNRLSNLLYGTKSENSADAVRNGIGVKTRCRHGHEYSSENTGWRNKGARRYRICKTCEEVWNDNHRERKRAKRRARRLANAA